jgi:hypothetical protein
LFERIVEQKKNKIENESDENELEEGVVVEGSTTIDGNTRKGDPK